MAKEVVMPRLGWTMEEGSIVEWLKQDGDLVRAGEPLFTIESDKAVNECEALDSGALHIPPTSPAPGVKVPIGAVLAYLVAPGEQLDSLSGSSVATSPSQTPAAPVIVQASTPRANATNGQPAISPRARRVAQELGIDWSDLQGSGRTGRIVERDIRAAANVEAVSVARSPRISPLARHAAAAAGVDLATVTTSAPGSRLTRADVEHAAQATTSEPTTPLSGMRRLVAARLSESARTTAPVTLTTEADATQLVTLQREAANLATDPPAPTITALLARLTALALIEHPALNVSLDGDFLVQHQAVHLGLAVETERGLLVPVVRDAERKSASQIAADASRLIAAARAGTVGPDDLTGGTFTITNLGMFDIDAFTPIINLPECAILGVGRIVARPVVIDEATEAVAVRKMMALSLTFDHRLVDGAPAARFLQHIKQFIEQPLLWLLR